MFSCLIAKNKKIQKKFGKEKINCKLKISKAKLTIFFHKN